MSESVLTITNLDEVCKEVGEQLSGSITVSLDDQYLKNNTKYRAKVNFAKAAQSATEDSRVDAAIDNWLDAGGSWESGGFFLQDVARQVKSDYVNNIMDDSKSNAQFKDLQARVIRIEEHPPL